MSDKELKQIKNILEKKMVECEPYLEIPKIAAHSSDHLDNARNLTIHRSQVAVSTQKRKEYDEIKSALHNIKIGTYGICYECGEDIGIKRLQSIPTATLCIRCKTLEEFAIR